MAFESSEDTEYTPKYLCKCTNAARVDLPSLSSHCDSVYYVFSDRSMYLAWNSFSAGYTSSSLTRHKWMPPFPLFIVA